MSAANPQHEPTMEEILASIRKIISEDQNDGAAAPQATPVRATAPNGAAAAETDVLELTEEVIEEKEEEAPAPQLPEPPAQPPIENDLEFQSIDTEPQPVPVEDLISDSARNAMNRAFAKLDLEPSQSAAPSSSGGILDALFLKAIQDAFEPVLQQWVDEHKADVMDGLKPLIREWMDAHLPQLIEAAVTKEISRALSERNRGH